MLFDQPEHALGYGKDDDDFNKDASSKMTTSVPKRTISITKGLSQVLPTPPWPGLIYSGRLVCHFAGVDCSKGVH